MVPVPILDFGLFFFMMVFLYGLRRTLTAYFFGRAFGVRANSRFTIRLSGIRNWRP